MNIEQVLSLFSNVRASRNEYLATCPAHNDKTPSLSIRESDGTILLKCFAGCSYEDIKLAAGLEHGYCASSAAPTQGDRTPAQRIELARSIWNEAQFAQGTLVAPYLRSRAITIPIPATIRFACLKHPIVREYFPTMVAAVQDVSGAITAIQRTYLKRPDGSAKANVADPKMSLGVINGGAVRLAPATDTVVLTEGIETGLSILQVMKRPVWVTLGTSGLQSVQLPTEITEVTIAADHDDTGLQAAQHAAQRFLREGRKVNIIRPTTPMQDFNDALMDKET